MLHVVDRHIAFVFSSFFAILSGDVKMFEDTEASEGRSRLQLSGVPFARGRGNVRVLHVAFQDGPLSCVTSCSPMRHGEMTDL